jgi:hypothetical protein
MDLPPSGREDGSVSAGRPDRPGGSCGKPAVLGAVSADRAGVSDLTGFRHRLTAMTPWFTPSDPGGPVIRQC